MIDIPCVTKAYEGGPEIYPEDEAHEAELVRPNDELERPKPRHITGKTPASVAIVAMGPSARVWHNGNGSYDLAVPRPDEVWCLNKGLRTVKCDVGFVLDDLVGEARRSKEYHDDLRAMSGLPIITTTVDRDVRDLFPANHLHAFPLEPIVWEMAVRFAMTRGMTAAAIVDSAGSLLRIGEAIALYLRNSIPMMLAYALWIGVEQVFLYGADYTYPGQDAREDDRANAEYWVGLCRGMGMEVQVCSDSTLLDMRTPKGIYGYGARPPVIRAPSNVDVAKILQHLGVIEGFKAEPI